MEFVPVENNKFAIYILLLGFLRLRIPKNYVIFENASGYNLMVNEDQETNEKRIMVHKFERHPIPEQWKNRIGKYTVTNS